MIPCLVRMTTLLLCGATSVALLANPSAPIATKSGMSAPQKKETLFKLKGKEFTADTLGDSYRQGIFEADEMRFRNYISVIENYLIDQHVEELASKQKKSKEEISKALFEEGVPAGDKEAKKWFDENKARLGNRQFSELKLEILHLLKRQGAERAKEELIQKLKKENSFEILLKAPEAPTITISSSNYPKKGSKNPKVTIVEFADYHCSHCRAASEVLSQIVQKYQDKVALVYMDFPLNPNSASKVVSEGGVCADEQSKFWDYHKLAFAEPNLTPASPEAFAQKLKLDITQFKTCLASPKPKEKVDFSRKEGERLGIQGTPALFINGKRIMGYSPDLLEAEIQKLL